MPGNFYRNQRPSVGMRVAILIRHAPTGWVLGPPQWAVGVLTEVDPFPQGSPSFYECTAVAEDPLGIHEPQEPDDYEIMEIERAFTDLAARHSHVLEMVRLTYESMTPIMDIFAPRREPASTNNSRMLLHREELERPFDPWFDASELRALLDPDPEFESQLSPGWRMFVEPEPASEQPEPEKKTIFEQLKEDP